MLKNTWQEEYKRKLTTAEDALKSIKSGDSVYIQSNAAAPQRLIEALLARAPKLEEVQIIHLLTLGHAEYARPEYAGSFKVKALFIGANVRDAVNEGRAEYIPIFLGEVPFLLESGELPVDVCLIQVSPPDAHGYCSYGVSVDCTIAARKKAKVVIAEVNKQMPRTHGRSFVHVSRLDHIVESDCPLPELLVDEPTRVEQDLGRFVAELVEDEATIQLGIGAIPNAVLRSLEGKKRLGVHSEMVSDGIVDLIEDGVITNECKTILPGKSAVSFLIGSKRLYNFVDNNPSIELQTSDFINDPYIISRNHKMTAINSALQVDVTGQVAADSIGAYLYSGFGGQLDFIRGAARSRNGKAIIALPSTAKEGTVSRITACLPKGAGVVTTRGDVHYVVTEYGIAQLFGRTLRERVNALISIAHPKFREELEREAHNFPWL
jgi:acetyl-CoA hydrolase